MKKTALSILLILVMVLGISLTAMSALAVETESEAVQTASEDTIQLLYDDRKDVSAVIGKSASSVTIEDEVVTSKKIGTTTVDDHVLVYKDGKIIAVGTGTATIVADGVSYAVEVKPARLSMFLITGHSVGAGQEGNAAQSVAVEAGQVYSSFQRTSLSSAKGGLGYGADVRAGGTGTGALDAFAPGQGGTRGVGSAMAYRWNQLTGEKVWVMNLAIPGSCINEWLPGVLGWHAEKDPAKETTHGYKYESVLTHFGYAQQIVKNEITAGHYTLGEMAMFYFSGANFGNANYNDWTYDSLKSDYETMWNGLKKDLAMDMDGDGDTETLQAMGIVPLWTPTNTDYRQDKALNYIMAASSDYPDVFIASDVYRDWVTTAGLAKFPAITYTTQSDAVAVPTSVSYSESTPNSLFCKADNTHLSQVTYNAVGLDMAQVYYNVTQDNDAITGITLQYTNGSAVPATMNVLVGTSSEVIVPALAPEYARNITVTASEGLEIVWPLSIKATKAGTGTVTFTAGGVTKTVTVNAEEDVHQNHCVCGGHGAGLGSHKCSTITWTAWGDDETEKTALPTKTGNYYLVCDLVNVNTVGSSANGTTINICLNGHNITMNGKRVYSVKGILSFTDCHAEADWGTVYSKYDSFYGGLFYTNEANDILSLYAGNFDVDGTFTFGGMIYNTSGTLNIYKANLDGCTVMRKDVSSLDQGIRDGRGGVICNAGGTTNIYGGTITGGKTQKQGGNIYVTAGTVNILGGTISGGIADSTLGTLTGGHETGGGNISVLKGTLNIKGGTITGGTSSAHGGNIYVGNLDVTSGSVAKLNITGGTVTGGISTTRGGNIYLAVSGTSATISGGTVSNGVAKTDGGNIHMCAGTALTVSGGTISGGKAVTVASKQGGNINMGNVCTLNITGGTIKDGRATGYGGNICGTPGSIINVSGTAVISGGKTGSVSSGGTDGTAGSGGNIFGGNSATSHSVITISGGTISDGFAKQGGNVTFDGNGSISGGTISGGKTPTTSKDNKGGNVYITAKAGVDAFAISGGTISGGQSFYGGNVYISGDSSYQRTVNMTDGTISGGTVTGVDSCGGNIYMAGILNLEDGIIKDGFCKTSNNACGGNIYVADTQKNGELLSRVNMTGGTISNGRSEQGGGGSIQTHSLFYMYGGEIVGGQSKNGGCVRVYRPGHFVLDGGTVSGGKLSHISDGNGGAAFMVEGNSSAASAGTKLGTLTIKSGTVIGNTDTKTVNGGAIMVGSNGVVNIEGGTINGGRGNNYVYNGKNYIGCGGTIYGYCTGSNTAQINISGGTINGGLGESFGGLLAVKPASTGLVDINITGGTFNGGKAPLGAMMYLDGANVDMDITGGKFVGGEAGTKGSLFWIGGGADVTISGGTFTCGTAPVADGICVTSGKLTLDGSPVFSGDGTHLYVENAESVILADTLSVEIPVRVGAPYVGKIATAATDKTACLASDTLSLTYNADDQGIYANGLLMAQDGTTFATLADGLASGDHAVFTLLSDHVGGGEIQGKVWLNLNGFTYTGDLNGEGTLYGYDTATDDYDIADMGRFNGTVTCNVAPHFLGTGADIVLENRYMAIPDENGYTFQRFDLKVSHISLRPATEGVGYKATVYGSDAVLANIETVGYVLQLSNCNPVSVEKAFDPAKTVITLRVDNYDVVNHGQTPLAATACITLKDGTVVESKTVTRSLRNMLEKVDASIDTLTNPQIAAVKAFCEKYATAMQGWDIADITGWVDPRIPTPEQMEGIDPANIYYVGPTREYTSVTKLFMDLEDDENEKIIFLDEGTYDIFREYRDLKVTTPPDDVTSPDYFPYCVFLPMNTRLIGLGDVLLDFSPEANEITYGESRTWSPLNIIGPCYIENIEIFCKNGRYAIHDDSHNAANDQGSKHIYKNVRAIYEYSDVNAAGKLLGFNNTIGNGMAQGTEFLFEDCYFEFRGSNSHCAFYTHESGSKNPTYVPTLTFRNCEFWGGEGNTRTVRLQNLATADLQIPTVFEDCIIEGGLYLTIYSENSAQHFDVTLIRSGNPPVMIDKPDENRYPVKIEE